MIQAASVVFGDDVHQAFVVKRSDREGPDGEKLPGGRHTRKEKLVIRGNPHPADIQTSYIERVNANVRNFCRRYTRRTYCFSKSIENHERHLALVLMYLNFCWLPSKPQTTRKNGVPEKLVQGTAAMAAGVSTTVWSVEDLVRLGDEYAEKQAREQIGLPMPQPSEPEPEETATHWVYWSKQNYTAKVHQAECKSCNGGKGKLHIKAMKGVWLPFASLEAALAGAAACEPDRFEKCKICLGSYSNSGNGYRGPRQRAG